jgi:hypothetical protein
MCSSLRLKHKAKRKPIWSGVGLWVANSIAQSTRLLPEKFWVRIPGDPLL